jgi:RsiW-degrading membrane proteinase PrsW (M82 family)
LETLTAVLAIIILAVVPMVLYALFLWWMDRYEKEPLGLILASFLWGAIPAVILSLIAQIVLDIPVSEFFGSSLGTEVVGASLIAPITEEPFKGLMLLLLMLFFRHEIDTPLDGILYGGLVGFGFATTENFFYFLDAYGMSGLGGVLELAFFRAVLFGLNHALFTGCTGLGIALARTSPRREVRIAAPFVGLGGGDDAARPAQLRRHPLQPDLLGSADQSDLGLGGRAGAPGTAHLLHGSGAADPGPLPGG